MNYEEVFGDFLRTRRKEAGLSIRDVAYHLGIAHSYVSQIENGVRPMPERVVEAWARLLGISVTEVNSYNDAADRIRLRFSEDVNISQATALARSLTETEIDDELLTELVAVLERGK